MMWECGECGALFGKTEHKEQYQHQLNEHGELDVVRFTGIPNFSLAIEFVFGGEVE